MLDVAAAREDLPCARAMVHLAEFAASLRTLGSYPRWREPEAAPPPSGRAAQTKGHGVADETGATAEVAERRHHRRPEPRAGARDAARRRVHRRGSEAAARRRRQHLDRDRPVQLPPARARRRRSRPASAPPAARRWSSTPSRSPTASRWARPGMRASLVSREVIADSIELVARGNLFDALVVLVGCDKTIPGAAMALARLDIPGVLLYGGSIAPGTVRRTRRHDPGRLRGGRRARGRPDDRRRARASSKTTPARAPARAAASSPPTRWPRRASSSGSRRWAAATCRRSTRTRPTSRERAGALVMDVLQARRPAVADHHARGARERDRRRSPRPAARPTPSCTCSRSRAKRASPLDLDDFDRDQRARAAARRPEAGRPLRRDRPAPRRRHAAGRAAPARGAACCTATPMTVTRPDDRRGSRDRRRDAGPGSRAAGRHRRSSRPAAS